jgi:prevent-host-death family protein
MAMSSYSVAEAKNSLPKLLDRMLAGEEVVITRRGQPIAQLNPHRPVSPPRAVNIDWLRSVRIKPATPLDSAALVREMRDDYRY